MLIVDASVAIKWVVPDNDEHREDGVAIALDLLSQALIAPDLMMIEFASAMTKKLRRSEVRIEQVQQALEVVPTIVDLLPTTTYVGRAFEMSVELAHPVYDCIYLALAEAHSLVVITDDHRFVRACTGSPWDALVTALPNLDR